MKIIPPHCILVSLLLMAGGGTALAQHVKFDLVTGTNGISLGKINGITKDKYGFMWFADQDNRSIIRYDGSHMTRYPYDRRNPNSLGGDHPECITTDSSGNIWVGFFGTGIDRFDPVMGVFSHFRHDPNDAESLSGDYVSAVLVDHLGNVWVGTNNGLDLLDQMTGKFKHYRYQESDSTTLSDNTIRTIYEDRSGELWVGTGIFYDGRNKGGLNHFHRDRGTFTRYRSDPSNPQTLIDNRVRSIFEDSQGTFWIGTNVAGLHTMDRKTGLFTRLPYNPEQPGQLSVLPAKAEVDHITFITEDAIKNIWIGTWAGGLTRYNPFTKQITRYNNKVDKTGLLNINTPWSAYPSSDGLVWISTDGNANLFKVNVFDTPIRHVEMDGVFTFNEEGDSVRWYGTSKGLIRKDLKNGTSRSYVHQPGNPNSISDSEVLRILKDKEGNFWIGTKNGLNHLNLKTETFTRYYENLSLKLSKEVQSLYEDSQSNIWVGTNGGGLDKLNPKTKNITNYKLDSADINSISSDFISSIVDAESNDLWIGTTTAGLNKMNTETGKFTHYLKDLSIQCLFKDATGKLWVGSLSGLYNYDEESDSFNLVAIGTFDDINVRIIDIIGDKEDNLWISAIVGFTGSARSGIYKMNKKRDQLSHYGNENGIMENGNLFGRSFFRSQDGEIDFGNETGYYALDIEKLKKTTSNTLLYFTSFWLDNIEIKPSAEEPVKESLYDTQEIRLNHDQSDFSISATFIDFRNTLDKTLYFQLENYDKNWRVSGAEDRMPYYKVPPGKYIFKVKTTNSKDGEWIEKSMAIIISPPWWNTWQAYAVYVVLFIASVYSVHRFQKKRVIRVERERTRERELAQAKEIEKAYTELKATQSQLIQSEKMASLGELTAGIAHEIQNPLNFVNNFSEVSSELIDEMKSELASGNWQPATEIANDVKQNLEKILHHGKRADAIVKGMLQHSRSSSGVKEPTDINALADEYLRLAYHGLRAKDKSFNAALKTDFDQTIGNINLIPQDIGRVILNLITNAFYAVNEKKRAAADNFEPTVTVSTKRVGPPPGAGGSAGMIEISVKDNGNGIPQKVLDKIFQPFFTTKPTGQGTGLGLSMSYDIVKAHGGDIKVNTKENEGSEFVITLPC